MKNSNKKGISATVRAFIICEILLVCLITLFTYAVAINRGDQAGELGIKIMMFGCLMIPLIMWTGRALNKSPGMIALAIVLMTALIITCAFILPKPIVAYRFQAKLNKNKTIAQQTKIEILEEKGIYKDGLIVGIHVRLMLSLPVSEDLKPILVVPNYMNKAGEYIPLTRISRCGTVNPPSSCRFLGIADHQSAVSWSSPVKPGKKRELYFDLVPAVGDSARWTKDMNPERYRVPTQYFQHKKINLPLRLGLLTPLGGETTHRDFNTLNKYSLREIYTNTHSLEVMEYMLTPVITAQNKNE